MTGRLFLCALVVAATAVVEGGVAGVAQSAIAGPVEIAGTVITTSDPPIPLARVLVTIRGESLKASRTLISDEHGRFAFGDLPPGTFTIVAARPPYVSMAFGAKRPGRPGTAINLAAGQRVTNISIALPRGAAIGGLIRHAAGEPAVGVNVTATPSDAKSGLAGAQAVTDDRGEYRIFGLPRGRYVVTAGVTESPGAVLTQFSDAEMDAIIAGLQRRSAGVPASTGAAAAPSVSTTGAARQQNNRRATFGYAPIHYAGTPDPDQAQTVELTEGEERAGIDISLQFVRTSALEGRVSNPAGAVPPGTQVTLTRLRQRPTGSPALPRMARPVDATGGFQFTGILPGTYRISASVRASITQDRAPFGVLWAFTDIVVGEDDVSGVAMMLQPGLRLSGRLVFEAGSRANPKDLTSIVLRLIDVNAPETMAPMAAGRADGTFEITGIVPGTYSLTSLLPDTGWRLRSVVLAGRDILDFPLEIGGDVTGAVATFTDRQAELSGTLQSATNISASDYTVLVFPRDRAFWRQASRRVQTARPNTDGRFVFRDLPAGDYLLAALTDIEPSDLGDDAFLEALIAAAWPVRLSDGEKKTQDLRLVGRGASGGL